MIVRFNRSLAKLKTRSSGFPIIRLGQARAKCLVEIISDNEEMGEAHGSGNYEIGVLILISAQANPGYKFSHWSDGNTEAIRWITVKNDMSLVAYFEEAPHTGILRYNPNQVYRETNTN